ncbi:MAG TPA: sigma-70 family RNA polymerase sigma factor [Candidatus Tectomicrobia bacterium]|nr:sigma-70 family RNA polymerase sigma factor [Candidatus Tectomicrobia bacterium]
MLPETEIDLVRRMAAGDEAAFARFYDRFAPIVYPLVLRIVREPAEAADVLQDAFWEAWRSAPSYDPSRGTPGAWIVTRARSRAIDRLRSIRRRGETFVPAGSEGAVADPGGAGREAAAEERGAVDALLGELPEAERVVIELAYYAGFTQTEIAARLRQPLGTVKTRLRQALARLRAAVKRTP